LTPPQHIDQIFQVINTSRPLVASAQRDDARAGHAHLPGRRTRPVVAVQGTEKTEAGNTVDGHQPGNHDRQHLSRRRRSVVAGVNWSTPDALTRGSGSPPRTTR
jgi:hypothetical protein